jgi:hypothetical protein
VTRAASIAGIGDEVRRRVRAWRRRGDSRVFTALTAIRPGHVGPLGQTLRALPPGEQSPLAKLPHVHFARWVVIDQLKTDWPGSPRRTPRLNSAYLLFTASLTVPRGGAYRFPQDFIGDIHTTMGDVVDEVWGHCMGYPGRQGRDDFTDYFMTSRVRTGIHHFGYRGATVDEVRRALTLRSRFADFALRHQGESGEALWRAYCEESATWLR